MKKHAVMLWGSWESGAPVSMEWFDDLALAWRWAAEQRKRKLVTRIVVAEILGEVS